MQLSRYPVLLLLVLGACDDGHSHHDHDHSHAALGEPTGALCPTSDPPTYESFARATFERYCTRCHSTGVQGAGRENAPRGVDFDTLELIRPHADHVDRAAAIGPLSENRHMPPLGEQPTDEERRKLGEWIACGAR